MTILWLCPKPAAPSGGVWFIHHCAHLLDRAHVPARVVQSEPFDVWWDALPVPEHIYPATLPASERQNDQNITVIPEVMWWDQWEHWPNPVLFLQNWLWLDKRVPLPKGTKVITCSRHMSNYAQVAYVGAFEVVGIIHPYVETSVFQYDPAQDSRKQNVLLMSRRNTIGERLAKMLTGLNYSVDVISEPMSQVDIAKHMAQAKFYCHLVSPEGWPQICSEAMQAGTVVVGTTGGGGNEFMFHRETAMVAQDSIYGYNITDTETIYQIVSYLNDLSRDDQLRLKLMKNAMEWTRQYNPDRTTAELVRVFAPMIEERRA